MSPGRPGPHKLLSFSEAAKIVQCATGERVGNRLGHIAWIGVGFKSVGCLSLTMTEPNIPLTFICFVERLFQAATLGYEVERPQSHRLISSPFDDVAVEHCC